MHQSVFSSARPLIAFLTDFGLSDGYVGVMKGVVLGIVPDAQLIDLTHDIAPQDVTAGAWILATCYRYFPSGTVFTCVVDPGVGSQRHAVALRTGDRVFVGPDNGLFSYVLAEQQVQEAVTLSNPTYHLPQVSATFQGRDVFAPSAAHIARGVSLTELGPQIDPMTLQRIDLGMPVHQGEGIVAHIVHIDHFGNLITNIPLSMVPDLFSSPGMQLNFPERQVVITERRRFFSEGSTHEDDARPFVYADSAGYIAVAIRNGNAARTLGVRRGETITFVQMK